MHITRHLWILGVLLLLGSATRPVSMKLNGRAASIAFDRNGALHVVYVDDNGRVAHAIGDRTTLVSPAGLHPDVRGEVTPLLLVRNDGSLVTVYPDKTTSGKWSSRLIAQRSADSGRTWSAPIVVNDDQGTSSHSFADATVNNAGDVVVSWLDSRTGQQGVVSTILRNDKVARNTSVDALTCECCRTALMRASNGSLWLAYRDLAAGDIRNMSYAISRDGGATFELKGPIADDRWSIKGCPDSGPRLAQTRDGRVSAVWMNGALPAIELAQFNGRSFDAPRRIAAPDANITMVNHPDIAVLPDGRLLIVYEATQRDGTMCVMSRIGDEMPALVARNAVGPRIAVQGNRAVIAYTERAAGKTFVRVVEAR